MHVMNPDSGDSLSRLISDGKVHFEYETYIPSQSSLGKLAEPAESLFAWRLSWVDKWMMLMSTDLLR